MTTYNLDDLLRICKPLDRIRRQSWTTNMYLTVPTSIYSSIYVTNYMISNPSMIVYYFTIDDILNNDWVRLDG